MDAHRAIRQKCHDVRYLRETRTNPRSAAQDFFSHDGNATRLSRLWGAAYRLRRYGRPAGLCARPTVCAHTARPTKSADHACHRPAADSRGGCLPPAGPCAGHRPRRIPSVEMHRTKKMHADAFFWQQSPQKKQYTIGTHRCPFFAVVQTGRRIPFCPALCNERGDGAF